MDCLSGQRRAANPSVAQGCANTSLISYNMPYSRPFGATTDHGAAWEIGWRVSEDVAGSSATERQLSSFFRTGSCPSGTSAVSRGKAYMLSRKPSSMS